MLPVIGSGFILIWLLAATIFWYNWRVEQPNILGQLRLDGETALERKTHEIEGVLQQTYQMIRTISLLPGVRSASPINRNSDAEDIVALGGMTSEDYATVQRLYNHIASLVAVSEIYIVYDGFNPDLGQVPYVMFDHIITDQFASQTSNQPEIASADVPLEDESAEYREYVRQLGHFRQISPTMPDNSLDNILPINSGILRTCDNSQYHSVSSGDVRHTQGFTISVPIYDLQTLRFKGLVTAVLRKDVIEAALIGWPVLPVTDADRERLSSLRGIDLDSPPVNFILEEQSTGIRISDSRHHDWDSLQSSAAHHFQSKLALPGQGQWVLHNYVLNAAVDNASAASRNKFFLHIGTISLLLWLLWLAVKTLLRWQRQTASQLRQFADIDTLTGLPNRRMIGMYLNAILGATRPDHYFAVVMIDLDDFKQVNDSLGHEAGDRMLIEIADRFNRVLRDDDHLFGDFSRAIDEDETDLTLSSGERVMGRLGGDEFLIVLGQMPERSIAHAVAERLLASLADPIEIGPERIYARVSIGISVYPDDGADAAVLMRNADIALYEAKRRGRDQSVIFEPELNADAKRRLKMVAALNEALQLEQFFLLYQPELHMATGRVKAAEGLLRWQHPDFGLVMPLEFIPLLERSGLIIDVGHWVLKTACQQLALWEKSGLSLQTISVNISPKQLLRENFVDMVKGTLVEAGISAERLVLEVTESIFIDNAEFAIHTLNQVRELGVHVAIDDFGTGYSSLSYLRKIPLDILKIDRSFVVETKTENGQAICDMLIELSSRLGLEVVAEGIEEQQQLSALGGVDWIQGFLIASPLDPEAFRDLALSKSGNGISIRARKSV
jgi:predicted signal transduction protein with EAL and GGDEF domain